jgi:hypothetical protein
MKYRLVFTGHSGVIVPVEMSKQQALILTFSSSSANVLRSK